MSETLFKQADADGTSMVLIGYKTHGDPGTREYVFRLQTQGKEDAPLADVFTLLARAAVEHEDGAVCPPTRLLRMTEEELAWAVRVVLRHSVVNVANAFLKARGTL
jgi:hypothetical protein